MRNQRGDILITLIIYAVIAGVAVAAIWGIVYKVQHWCNKACVQAQSERDVLAREKKEAQERATALAGLWAATVEKADAAANQRQKETNATFATLNQRIAALSHGTVAVSSAANLVLRDITDAANATNTAAASQVNSGTAAAVSEAAGPVEYDQTEFVKYIASGAEAYRIAFGKWQSCVEQYNNARADQLKIAGASP